MASARGTFIMVWPIIDDSATLDELKAEAGRELHEAIAEQDILLLDAPTWEVHHDLTWPHPDGAMDGLTLVARAPASHTSQLDTEQAAA